MYSFSTFSHISSPRRHLGPQNAAHGEAHQLHVGLTKNICLRDIFHTCLRLNVGSRKGITGAGFSNHSVVSEGCKGSVLSEGREVAGGGGGGVFFEPGCSSPRAGLLVLSRLSAVPLAA